MISCLQHHARLAMSLRPLSNLVCYVYESAGGTENQTLTLTLTLKACALLQVLHGLVLATPQTCLRAIRSLTEATMLLLYAKYSSEILAALSDSMLSLEVKSDDDHFAVCDRGGRCAGRCRVLCGDLRCCMFK